MTPLSIKIERILGFLGLYHLASFRSNPSNFPPFSHKNDENSELYRVHFSLENILATYYNILIIDTSTTIGSYKITDTHT